MTRWLILPLLAGLVAAAPPAAPFKDVPSGPRALHGDVLPPFGSIGAAGTFDPGPREVPAGFALGANRPPETTAPGPSMALATRAAQAAIAACARAGYRIGVAVIDSAGQARVLLNADGTDGSHGFVAMRKAEAARVFAMPSSAAHDRIQHDPAMLKRATPAMFIDGGAVPLIARGRVIGAIGASGAAGKVIGAQDEACAIAGRDAIARAPR